MAGVSVGVMTGGIFGAIAGLAVAGIGALTAVGKEQKRKCSFLCNGCAVIRYSTLKYRCG